MKRHAVDLASLLGGALLAAGILAGAVVASPIRKWGLW